MQPRDDRATNRRGLVGRRVCVRSVSVHHARALRPAERGVASRGARLCAIGRGGEDPTDEPRSGRRDGGGWIADPQSLQGGRRVRLLVSVFPDGARAFLRAATQQPIEGGAARVRGIRPGVELRARSAGRAVGTLDGASWRSSSTSGGARNSCRCTCKASSWTRRLFDLFPCKLHGGADDHNCWSQTDDTPRRRVRGQRPSRGRVRLARRRGFLRSPGVCGRRRRRRVPHQLGRRVFPAV